MTYHFCLENPCLVCNRRMVGHMVNVETDAALRIENADLRRQIADALSREGQEMRLDTPPVWRVGRSVGRTVYVGDQLIGLMDTSEAAALVVAAVNLHISRNE